MTPENRLLMATAMTQLETDPAGLSDRQLEAVRTYGTKADLERYLKALRPEPPAPPPAPKAPSPQFVTRKQLKATFESYSEELFAVLERMKTKVIVPLAARVETVEADRTAILERLGALEQELARKEARLVELEADRAAASVGGA